MDGRKVLVNVKLDQDDSKIISFVSVYAPNVPKDRKHFLKNLPKWITCHAVNIDNIILCGDFNCCVNDDDKEPRTHLNECPELR